MSKNKIPAFRVRVVDATSGQEQELHSQKFLAEPGVDFVSYTYGPMQWDNIAIRRKTFDGDMLVTFREESAGVVQGQRHSAAPGRPIDLPTSGGQLFRVVVDQLPKTEWAAGQALKFKPPAASIVAEQTGWRVTFMPAQHPCVLTVAVDSKGTKDEKLPSFPFPANPQFASGSFVIPYGQFGAQEGGIVRLGVRGAGLETKVALPRVGERVDVEGTAFENKAPAQPALMTDNYVLGKYQDHGSLIQYG